MRGIAWSFALLIVGAISGCHTTATKNSPVNPGGAVEPPAEAPAPAVNHVDSDAAAPAASDVHAAETRDSAACTCGENAPKPVRKRKPMPVVRELPAAPPAAAPLQAAPGEANVKLVEGAPSFILGRKVRARDGDDLGRVVDVLADGQGRVRIAIIEFGGFLGVGNRRIGVDWTLLKFPPGDVDAPVIVKVSRDKLQATPEFKNSDRPLALMAPDAAPAATQPPATTQ